MRLSIPTPMELDQVQGRWRNVRWQPNASTGELINIGVVFEASNGRNHVRMLDYFERLKCMYDAPFARDAKFLVAVTKEALSIGAALPSPSVMLSEPKFAAGRSVEEILDAVYSATVPLGRMRQDAVTGRRLNQSESKEDVRTAVLDALRRISGEKASRLINSEQTMQVIEGGRSYHLDIPLQTERALGTIVAARTRHQDSELALHRADTDLQLARRIYHKDDLFMYVVRSQTSKSERADELLDEFTWKFKHIGVQMKTYSDAELVAPDIIEDMPVASWM